jgi:hypothetical protein
MAGDRDDEDRPEDLFEDLDSFFSPQGSKGSPGRRPPGAGADSEGNEPPRGEPAAPSGSGGAGGEDQQD